MTRPRRILLGGVQSKFGPVGAKQERRAEDGAALRLIDHDEYRYLEYAYGGTSAGIALELGVRASIMTTCRGLLQRIGDATYVSACMSAGQWLRRVEEQIRDEPSRRVSLGPSGHEHPPGSPVVRLSE